MKKKNPRSRCSSGVCLSASLGSGGDGGGDAELGGHGADTVRPDAAWPDIRVHRVSDREEMQAHAMEEEVDGLPDERRMRVGLELVLAEPGELDHLFERAAARIGELIAGPEPELDSRPFAEEK